MHSSYGFSPVWNTDQLAPAPLLNVNASNRKRKHREIVDAELSGSDEEYAESEDGRSITTVVGSDASRDPFWVAGHLTTRSLPPRPFPHAAISRERDSHEPRAVGEPIVSPDNCSYPASSQKESTLSLRQHHMSVLTSIMHDGLARGDYIRAGRAWGLLLRTNHQGRPIDLRVRGRWGIGAEILLRRDAVTSTHAPHPERSDCLVAGSTPAHDVSDQHPGIGLSSESFHMAKNYYELLILQYPYQRQHATSVNALTFYPAMFGLCIFEAVESSKQRMLQGERNASEAVDPALPATDQDNFDGRRGEEFLCPRIERSEIRRTELGAAKRISERLDELLLSPPFDKYGPLLQLQGMIALWMADLYREVSNAEDRYGGESGSPEVQFQPYVSRQETRRNLAKAEERRTKAKAAFIKVLHSGGVLHASARAFTEKDP